MMNTENRLFHMDALRVALTILVIAHNVGQASGAGCGLTALWYACSLWLRQSLPAPAFATAFLRAAWHAAPCCGICMGVPALLRLTGREAVVRLGVHEQERDNAFAAGPVTQPGVGPGGVLSSF